MAPTTKNVINPAANSRRIDRQILNAERLFLIIAVLITSIGFYVWGSSTAAQYTDIRAISVGVGLLAAIASGYVTDYAFRQFLEEVVYEPLAAIHPSSVATDSPVYFRVLKIVRWIILATVVALLFCADWYSVQTIKDPFAASAKQGEIVNVAAVTATVSGQYDGVAAPLAAQINTLKADIRAEERRVEAGNGALAALVAKGNGWAAKELSKKKERATKAARAELASTQAAYTAALQGRVAAVNSSTAAIQRSNDDTERTNAENRAALSGMFFLFGAGSKAMTVLMRIFLVVSFLAKNPTLDANGDGVVDGRDVSAAARGGDADFR